MASSPLVLPAALPSELLSYVVTHCAHPTTLIICSPRSDFLAGLVDDVRHQAKPPQEGNGTTDPETSLGNAETAALRLLQAPLYQVAVARHIRVVFVPTVSHLRAFLAVFSPGDSKVPAPPAAAAGTGRRQAPLLLTYGFLEIHRNTSEWSAQGLASTASCLVEAARRASFRAVVVEPKTPEGHVDLAEAVPILGGSLRRMVADADEGSWTSRTAELRRVLGRWFRFGEDGPWEEDMGFH